MFLLRLFPWLKDECPPGNFHQGFPMCVFTTLTHSQFLSVCIATNNSFLRYWGFKIQYINFKWTQFFTLHSTLLSLQIHVLVNARIVSLYQEHRVWIHFSTYFWIQVSFVCLINQQLKRFKVCFILRQIFSPVLNLWKISALKHNHGTGKQTKKILFQKESIGKKIWISNQPQN